MTMILGCTFALVSLQGLLAHLASDINEQLSVFLDCDFVVGFGVFGLNYKLPSTDREHTEASDNLQAGIYGNSLRYCLDIDIDGQLISYQLASRILYGPRFFSAYR